MRLTSLALKSFMGYEDLDLDLRDTDAAVVVGENGSGKSALLDAIMWALYDRINRPDVDTQDALIRDGADDTRVDVGFTSAGRTVAVSREKQRGRTGALNVTVDGQPRTAHTQRETLAVIASLVGLTYEGLMAGPIMAQEDSGAFMKARPAQRKDLLANWLGLDRYGALNAEARKRMNEATASAKAKAGIADSMRGRMDDREALVGRQVSLTDHMRAGMEAEALASDRKAAAMASGADAKARLQAAERAQVEGDRLAAEVGRLDAALVRERERTRRALAIIDSPVPDITLVDDPPSDDLIEATRESWEAARTAAVEFARVSAQTAEANASVERMTVDRARVASVPCGGVGEYAACQFLVAVPSAATVALFAGEARRLAARAGVLLAEGSTANPLRQRLDQLVAQRSEVSAARQAMALRVDQHATAVEAARQDLADSKAAFDSTEVALTAAQDAAQKAARVDVTSARMEVDTWRVEAQEAANAYTEAQAARRDAERALTQVEGALAALTALQAEVEALEEASRASALQGQTYGLLAEAFGRDGIPSRILAAAIPAIEQESNRILGRLPGDLTLSLRTERTLRTGASADTLDVVVSTNGWDRQYGMLSVGQRFRVDLALRLGLARVLASRSGSAVETLWLDEPLAALDADSREAVMETLAGLEGEFGLLIVVSHHADFNDRFQSRIDVEILDGISTATLS